MKMIQYMVILCITISCYSLTNAQNAPIEQYFQQAKEYAEIYNGKIEPVYNVTQYKDFPYYRNTDFTEATIIYRNNYYPNQKVRLDLFQEQLIVLVPEKQHGIILSSKNVKEVYMYNKTIVWLIPPKDSGLKPGYYIRLKEGEKLLLLCKEKYIFQQKIQSNTIYNYFEHNIRFHLHYNNKYYPVKNKGSFSKVFPQFKKQINKFVKDYKLNFEQNKDISLTLLTGYCEELLISTNNQ